MAGDAAPRDQKASGFAPILQRLLDAVPAMLAVALVDFEGETVDYAGVLEPFDTRIAAAHLQLELRHVTDRLAPHTGPVRNLIVRTMTRHFVVRPVAEGYALVMVLGRNSSFTVSERAVCQAEWELRTEAGWDTPCVAQHWVHARVEAEARDRWRPRRVLLGDQWQKLEVMGTVMGLAGGERGFRVRTENGVEMTLVRELQGQWFADVT